jgi:hypothetical protein
MTIEEKCMRDTIDMAREAGFETMLRKGKILGVDRDGDYTEELKDFEALVRADEREACAKVCESFQQDPYEELLYKSDFAAAIRARGEASIRSKA